LAPKPIDIFSYLFKSHFCLIKMKVNQLSISGCSLQDKWRHRHLNSRDSIFQNDDRFQVLTHFNGREDTSSFKMRLITFALKCIMRGSLLSTKQKFIPQIWNICFRMYRGHGSEFNFPELPLSHFVVRLKWSRDITLTEHMILKS
jgi:hypothetical protein